MDQGTPPLFAAYPEGFPAAVGVGRTVSLKLFIAGKPEPLHRHRARVVNPKGKKPFVQMYSDKRSAEYEERVAAEAVEQLLSIETERPLPDDQDEDFTLPLKEHRVLVTLRFNLVKPVSYPKSVVHHTKKPDIDNYAKAVLDGLVKGRIIEDDGLVTDLSILKRYVEPGHPEGVEIDLTAIPAVMA